MIFNGEVRAAFLMIRPDEVVRPWEGMKLDLHSPERLRDNNALKSCDRYMTPLEAADVLKIWLQILTCILCK